ncbi:hypothetical protein [Nostoc sp.]|uniref:hypothetical protein n=1 Tax=Nostoc sp. TaxID=1180 RepID=UPI002FF7659C
MEIIDTPSFNDHLNFSEVIEKYCIGFFEPFDVVDAVVFVFSCETLANRTEIDLIEDFKIVYDKDLFFVCNRFDEIPKKYEKQVKEYALSKLTFYTQKGENRIFFVSVLNALEGYLDNDKERGFKSGVFDFEKEINNLFLKKKRLNLSTFASKLATLIANLKEQIFKVCESVEHLKRRDLNEEIEFEVQQKITAIQLDRIEKQLREVCSLMD